jgi:hypothetical protein
MSEARNAEPGDKVAAFFYNLLGFGLGNFVGWEIGKQILNRTEIIMKLLPNIGAKHLLGPLKFLPLLGRITIGGFITEIIAMFILSKPFEMAGEWIANLIFGKPKKVHEEEAKAKGITMAKPLPPSSSPTQLALYRNKTAFQPFIHPQPTAASQQPPQTPTFAPETPTPQQIAQNKAAQYYSDLEKSAMDIVGKADPHNLFDSPFSYKDVHGGGH